MENNIKNHFGNNAIDIFSYVCIMYYMTIRANNILLELSILKGGALARICFSPKE
ncbi:MAG: hypothetical protein UX89_C0022G0011 [Parcubacteria group bacterium GW2011_GWA2_47_16]|nr:MAG: hypothetical protein UX89_C0022G0011 [Parcubacteria group bacterium GW2011_GWA2_47_16]